MRAAQKLWHNFKPCEKSESIYDLDFFSFFLVKPRYVLGPGFCICFYIFPAEKTGFGPIVFDPNSRQESGLLRQLLRGALAFH